MSKQDTKGVIKLNNKLLRSVMILYGDTNRDLAKYLGISQQSVSSKINENGTEFRQGEIAKIKDRYSLSAEQINNIFFDTIVSK